MRIVNLTQHTASAEQKAEGVFDLVGAELKAAKEALNVDNLPSPDEVEIRVANLAELAYATGAEAAMIGGAPFLMAGLHVRLGRLGIGACYAFSKRVSIEETQPDGSVKKTSVFKHEGFVWPFPHYVGVAYPGVG